MSYEDESSVTAPRKPGATSWTESVYKMLDTKLPTIVEQRGRTIENSSFSLTWRVGTEECDAAEGRGSESMALDQG